MTYPLILAKIPVKNPWEIVAYLPFGNWNECPDTPELMACLFYTSKNEVPDEDGIREIVDLWKNEDSGEIAPAWPEHLDWLIKRLISEQEA